MLKVENISYSYKNSNLFSDKYTQVLNGVSFNLDENNSLGILGISGSGKSTLAKIIANIYKANSGNVFLNNVKIQDNKEYKKIIQIVFQDSRASFNPDFSVYEALIEPLENLTNFSKSEIKKRALECLELLELNQDLLDKKCSMLSGGQLQRLSIARAISIKPKILILDEATSSLDVLIQAKILKTLKNLQKDLSYIVITHDLRIIKLFCDEVLVLDKGKVIESKKVSKDLEFESLMAKELSNSILKPFPKDFYK
ncbi:MULTISPECIES: dipeptide/oligopeptide/nickel ABC transporter ATP-binding protein [unclassified Campylobacter]|uniref:ABC transporter ATP-binding protein n=1 Tax=unclassified Campylobacter TaxID=2593542 RepID=UPI001BD96645|nr:MULTISPECIES: dipeptide/oligopeptide/nickel ABC transporter ATP-binding protein [unclassified Campylobacter]MBT0880762.1 dipeptide/oligopeptide/nickel ABC transporter ATP-binding protein [Campylobacter sp. 2018MI27]MBT0885548.1 dipeptide/oligopeptide/nickel ABC transporter ATP-binding protein [Campylobacter sp. 2018MI10]